jgi:hypothetical protein
MNSALAATSSRGVYFVEACVPGVHATNRTEEPSKECGLNGNDMTDERFVCPGAVAYTECFAVPSNSK